MPRFRHDPNFDRFRTSHERRRLCSALRPVVETLEGRRLLSSDLAVTKTDGVPSVVPGTPNTYFIVVSNQGPDAVTGATVSDPLPAGVTAASWAATASSGGGTVSGPSSGTGALASTVDLPVNATVTFAFTVQVSPSATGSLINIATVSPPGGTTDANPGNNSATDTDTLTPRADLSITKDDGVTSAIPGTSTTYTIVVRNAGPSTAVDQAVADVFPSAITAVSWTALASAGSSVAAASGTDDITTTVTLLPGGTVTFTAVAQISPAATGSLSNTATVAEPPGDATPDNSATDVDSLSPLVGLSIAKTDGQTTAVPGTSTTYTILVRNAGPSTFTGVALSDPLPAGVTAATWAFGGATDGGVVTGPTSGTGALATTVNLPVGATVTFTFTVQVDPSATGSLVNTATVTPPGGTPTGATDTNSLTPRADLSITKTDGKTSAVPGTPVTYTITVRNDGPSTVGSLTLTDALPAALLNPSFGTPSAGSYDPATGIWSALSLATGQSLSITLTGTIDPAATVAMTNSAHVSPPAGVVDPDPADNGATDTDTLVATPDLTISKNDGVTSAQPGDTLTYTLTISNVGGQAATGATVSDTLPANTSFVSGSDGGTFSSGVVTWSIGSLAAGATATRTVTVQVNSTVPAGVTSLTNSATATDDGASGPDPTPGNNTATDTDTLVATPDLVISKNDGVTSAQPGDTLTYTLTISNVGGQGATGATASDTLPANTSFVSASDGGTFSSGVVTWSIGSLTAGATATRTVTVIVNDPLPAGVTSIANTATVTDDGANGPDPTPGNNTATDTDTLVAAPDLVISKNDGVTSAQPGDTLTYTLTISNVGGQAATGVTASDTLPANTSFVSASDGGTFSNGVVTWSIGSLFAGATATRTVTVLIANALPLGVTSIANTATVTDDGGNGPDPTPGNNTAADTDNVTVAGAQVVTDPSDPTKTSLIVSGTSGNDAILIDKGSGSSSLKVTLNGVVLGTFPFTGALFVLGQEGNDTITVAKQVNRDSFLYGNGGNDTITVANGRSVAIGGDGDDAISTGNGRDVLIGGDGADVLDAGNDDDILIAGTTSFDAFNSANATALRRLRDEWSQNSYTVRINRLLGNTPGSAFVFHTTSPGQNVFDDTAVDHLIGGNDNDWFIGNFAGPGVLDLTDRRASEQATDL